MLKKTITYTNPFTDKEVTEEHYFHISKGDLVEMQLEEHDATYTTPDGEKLTGMQAKLQRISDSNDGRAIIAGIKDIIRRAYGKKEGERFVKSDAIWEEFSSSEAFSQLLFDLSTNPEASAEFVNGIVPPNLEQIAKEVQERAEKIAAGRSAQETAKVAAAVPEPVSAPDRATQLANATPENPVTLTESEIREIDSDELKSGLATGRYKLS